MISNSSGSLTYTNNNGISGGSISIPNETICNGTFQTDNSAIANGTLTNFVSNQNSSVVFEVSIPIISSNRDEINDENNLIDLLHTQYSIPKILNDDSAIPNGTWAFCSSRDGVVISGKNVILSFNGTTWILQTTYPNGNPVPALQDVCGSLSILEIENNENKISIYPNPTKNFIIIPNRENATDNFEYKIVDLTGRIVKNCNSNFKKQINIESLTNGNYIIQIQTNSNQNFTQKSIKN